MTESPMGAPAGLVGAGASGGARVEGGWRELERPDARAVEVVVLFDGAIVDARHFDDPACGALRPATRWRIVGGGVALALALGLLVVAFVHGGGPWLDGAALALVVCGGAALVGGLLRRHDELRPRDLTVGSGEAPGGSARRALLPITGVPLPADPFPLLRSTGTGYELLWAPGLRGELFVGGGAGVQRRALEAAAALAEESDAIAGARALPLCDGMRVRVDLGALTVHLRSVAAPRRQRVPLVVDLASLRYTGAATLAAALFLALAFAVPPDARALSLGDLDLRQRFVSVTLTPPVEPERPSPAWLAKKAAPGAGPGRAPRGPRGKAGRSDRPDARRKLAIAGDKAATPHLARADVERLVRSTGVLGALASRQPALASLFSRDLTALGNDATSAMGNLVGTTIGDARGDGGLDVIGSGRGGDGRGEGTIGVGDHGLDTIGRGGGGGCAGCDGYGLGRTGGLRAHKVREVPPVDHATVSTADGLDGELVRRVVRRHINEVRFCYEVALQARPDLHGRVVVRFAIAPLGTVSSSVVQSSTLDPQVAQCVSQSVRRWEFPRAARGGMTLVTYPFTFVGPGVSPAGER